MNGNELHKLIENCVKNGYSNYEIADEIVSKFNVNLDEAYVFIDDYFENKQ